MNKIISGRGVKKMKIEKNVLPMRVQTKKEAITMIKKCLAMTLAALIVIFNVLPAQAYTQLATPVTLTASGTIAGEVAAFSVGLANQNDGTDVIGSSFTFPAPAANGKTNSAKSLKITGSTNVVGNRIIIYADNDALFTDNTKDPRATYNTDGTINKYSGNDGSGMIGATNSGYVVPLVWGATATPNTPATYACGASNWTYVVDKWHKKTYVPTLSDGSVDPAYAVLDTANFYRVASNTPELNLADEGSGLYKKLYPQYFGNLNEDWDLYDKPATDSTRKLYTLNVGGVNKVLGQSLYKNIATIAFGVLPGLDNYYTCNVAQPGSTGTVMANLKKKASAPVGTVDQYIYIPVGADFNTLPAQTYSTSKLVVLFVQD